MKRRIVVVLGLIGLTDLLRPGPGQNRSHRRGLRRGFPEFSGGQRPVFQ